MHGRTFKQTFTGTSADAIRPKRIALMSEGALTSIGLCLFNAERQGRWADQMRLLLVFLLGKPSGGWRLIGLLNFVRVEALAEARTDSAVTSIGDLEKGFENVGHDISAEAAVKHSCSCSGWR